jgi:gamma-glutamylputrescine oxidase
MKTVILEGARAGEGASSRNQGSINHGAAMGYLDCIQRHSREFARRLWQLGLENHRLLREQIEEYRIDCDYQVDGMTSLVRRDIAGWERQFETYRREADLLREDGFEVAFLDEKEAIQAGGSPLYAGALCYLTDAQFHSGKFVLGLAEAVARLPHVELFEDARVLKLEKEGSATRVTTPLHTVTAEHVFLCTNALAPQIVPSLERALRAERGQVFVTEPLPERPCRGSFGTSLAWWREIREPGGRFRLLFGGGRERDEPDSLFPQFRADGSPHPKLESEGFSPSPAHQQRLEVQFGKLFPRYQNARITHRWGGLQCFTADSLPEVGFFDPEQNLYGIAGFCGRGNCHSDVGAEYLAGKAAGVESNVERQFGPLIEALMRVGRESANWEPWYTLHDEN